MQNQQLKPRTNCLVYKVFVLLYKAHSHNASFLVTTGEHSKAKQKDTVKKNNRLRKYKTEQVSL